MRTSRLSFLIGITLVILGLLISLGWIGLLQVLLDSGTPDTTALSISTGGLVLLVMGPAFFLSEVIQLLPYWISRRAMWNQLAR